MYCKRDTIVVDRFMQKNSLRREGFCMAKTLTLHTTVEPDVKEKADAILSELGISTSEAINMFLHQVVRYRGIPLDLRVPNAETLQAIEETEEIFSKGTARFSNLDEMFEELEK